MDFARLCAATRKLHVGSSRSGGIDPVRVATGKAREDLRSADPMGMDFSAVAHRA